MTAFPRQGQFEPVYEPLARAFDQLLTQVPQGAALCVYQGGRLVVDLWGGARDKAGALPWQESTQVNIFSAGKPLVAVAILRLVAEGKLALDAPVAHYWPGFAVAGKAQITLRQVLCHRSGLCAFHARVADAAIFDPAQVRDLLEQESPWWAPGSDQGYSPILYGWILAELVRRVTGTGFNAWFQREIGAHLAGPVDFGVPAERQAALADVAAMKGARAEDGVIRLGQAMKADAAGVVNKAFTNPMSLMVGTNGAAWRSAEIPAANGHASARALASAYDLLLRDEALLPVSVRELCWQQQSDADDRILQTPMRFSCGFMLSQAGADRALGDNPRSFGHAGAGGCLGFADPDAGISYAFVSNQMAQSLLIDSRNRALIDCLYQDCLGH